MKSIGETLANICLHAVMLLSRLLPYKTRVKTFGFITGHFIAPVFGFLKKGVANLRLIHPEMPDHEARQIARQVSVNFGKTVIENYAKRDLLKMMQADDITGDGLQAALQAIEEKRPILVVSGHIGNYEVIRIGLLKLGYQSACLYRPATNKYFNSHFAKTYSELTGPGFPQTSKGFLGFTRYLADGGIAAILFDVRAEEFEDIEFMGLPAPTSDVPAKIALKQGALFLPCFAHRKPDGLTHALSIEAPIEHTTPRQMMTEVSKRLEAQVAKHPDQWFWIHDRWGSAEYRAQKS